MTFAQSFRFPLLDQSCVKVNLAWILLAIFIIVLPVNSFAANPLEGQPAPVWPAMADMAGEMRSMEPHLGRDVILIDFWSIYCVSCIQEMPSLVDLYEKYKDQGFMLYGIDLDSFSPRRVKKFIDSLNFKIPYPVIIDKKRQIAAAYKVGMLPTTIIIGRDGKVKMFHIGYKPGDEKEFDHLIESLLK
jgi:peroxiredoxin